MPLYEYVCSVCGSKFELLRKFDQADEQVSCPDCGQVEVRRVLSTFAAVSARANGSTASLAGSNSCNSCSATSCASCRR